MRLILILEQNSKFINKFDFREDDIILSEKGLSEIDTSVVRGRCFSIGDFNIDRKGYVQDYEKCILDLLPSTKEIIRAHGNTFFNHIIIPVSKWVTSVDQLIVRFSINEIILSDFIDSGDYVPYYESEGEINRGLLYKKFDFIPRIIKETFNGRIKVSYFKVHSKILLHIRIFLRRYCLLFIKLFIGLFYKQLRIFHSNYFLDNLKNSENIVILISRGVAHTDYMQNLVKLNSENMILHVGEGLFNFGRNLLKVESLEITNFTVEKDFISSWDHIISFCSILKQLLVPKNGNYRLKFSNFEIDFKSAINEFAIQHNEALLHQKSLSNLIRSLKKISPNSKLAVITGEFYGPFSYVTGIACKREKIASFQLQNFVCDLVEDVNFLNCDNILFHSLTDRNKFARYFPHQADNFYYWGNIKFDNVKLQIKRFPKKAKKIIYFSQPIVVQEEQAIIIRRLLMLGKVLNFDLTIKLHPRDKLSFFEEYLREGIIILEGISNINDYIDKYDLAVIQTSAVGQQIILHGVPIIICQISNYTRSISADFIDDTYIGCIKEVVELDNLIMNYDKLVDSFVKYRETLIIRNGWMNNIIHFNSELVNYLNDNQADA